MEVQQDDKLKTLSYSGIFLSCFADYSEKCIHATPEHVLVYLYSGEQVIEDRNKKIKLKAGVCAFNGSCYSMPRLIHINVGVNTERI